MRRAEPTPELLAEIREIRADRANWNRGRPPGFERLAEEWFPEVDRLLVRRAAEVVMAEEKAASTPGTAVAVPDGAAPELFEPEPIDGDVESQFSYQGHPIRVVELDGEPWFVASDLAKLLGYRDADAAVRTLRPHHRGYENVRTPGGVQRMVVVSEAGLNRLLIKSNASNADQVQDWITDDVLPSVRKTGAYVSPAATPTQLDQLSEELEARKAVAFLNVLTAARDLVGDDWTRARARSLVAGVVGGEAEIDMTRRPLMVEEYLKEKGLRGDVLKKHRGPFGKIMKALYIAEYGEEPHTRETDVDGHWITACAYSERDRPLMNRAWRQLEESFRDNGTDY